MKVFVTGATGFVGRALVTALSHRGRDEVRALVRNRPSDAVPGVNYIVDPEWISSSGWAPAMRDVETVVHAAARAHVLRERRASVLEEYRRANVDAAVRVARLAASTGVRRMVFLSSIKVNGESTNPGSPFTETSDPQPTGPYAVTKFEAEQALQAIAAPSGMDLVIVRPVLVYGPGVKGNLAELMRWIQRGVPLPFGAIRNLRSYLALDNLISFLLRCIGESRLIGQTFLLSDGEDLSTPELIARLSRHMGSTRKQWSVPTHLLKLGALACGKSDAWHRLSGSLQVDSTLARSRLEWSPVIDVESALRVTAESFQATMRS